MTSEPKICEKKTSDNNAVFWKPFLIGNLVGWGALFYFIANYMP